MTRKILFGVLTVTLFVAGFSLASFPALAELRTITITLVGGQEVVTTVDVPPGTPPEAIQLPGAQRTDPEGRGRWAGCTRHTDGAEQRRRRHRRQARDRQGCIAGRVPRRG